MRGSKRIVMVVESRASTFSNEAFIRRGSMRVSCQNFASASSVSKRGTSRQFVIARISQFVEPRLNADKTRMGKGVLRSLLPHPRLIRADPRQNLAVSFYAAASEFFRS